MKKSRVIALRLTDREIDWIIIALGTLMRRMDESKEYREVDRVRSKFEIVAKGGDSDAR